jgi:hypothetical protein
LIALFKWGETLMILLFLSLLAIGLSLAGIGFLAGKLFGLRPVRNPWLYWWLGFFSVSTLSMLFSLFFPVNNISLIAFFIAGFAGLFLLYREYKRLVAREPKTLVTAFVYVIILLLADVSFRLAVPELTGAYDTGLYHAQTVRWLNEYGTPFGLGNLHTRLAFNSSWLSFAALIDNGLWDNRSECLLPALLWIGAFFYFLYELLFARRNGVRLYALCILIWSIYYYRSAYPNLYYDDSVHVINAVVMLEAYYLIDRPVKERVNDTACVLALSAAAFMIKPIGAVSLVFAGILAVFPLLQNKKPAAAWIKILWPSACALAVWITRNILLSGYPLYPVPVLPLPFDWTMTYEAVKSNYDAVMGWARMPGASAMESLRKGFLFWFKPWLIRNLQSKDFRFLAVFPFSLSVFFWFLAVRLAKSKRIIFFLVWSQMNILYWFLSAPDIRFGGGFFWVSLALSLLFLFPSESRLDFSIFLNNKIIHHTFYYVWILAIVGIIGRTALSAGRSFFTIGSAGSFPVKEYTVNTGAPFTIWVPQEGDRTGNSPLPSAPYPVDNIEMRKHGDLGKGFRPVK